MTSTHDGDAHDGDASLRPTLLKPQLPWTKRSQASLLSKRVEATVDDDGAADEKRKAFALLDALTRSGALPLASADLHVMVAATHAFDHSVAHTVVVDNEDPILKSERASLWQPVRSR